MQYWHKRPHYVSLVSGIPYNCWLENYFLPQQYCHIGSKPRKVTILSTTCYNFPQFQLKGHFCNIPLWLAKTGQNGQSARLSQSKDRGISKQPNLANQPRGLLAGSLSISPSTPRLSLPLACQSTTDMRPPASHQASSLHGQNWAKLNQHWHCSVCSIRCNGTQPQLTSIWIRTQLRLQHNRRRSLRHVLSLHSLHFSGQWDIWQGRPLQRRKKSATQCQITGPCTPASSTGSSALWGPTWGLR